MADTAPRYAGRGARRKLVDAYRTPLAALLLVLLAGAAQAMTRAEPRGVVAIDPGHGGANLGAPGQRLYEKQLTLQVAQRLRRLLQNDGYRVVLTREDDRYLTLRQRVRLCNAAQPLVFLSLHANASPDHSQRGVETFVLDRAVAEVEARRQARHAGGPVAALLADTRASAQLRDSLRLGRLVQESLYEARGGIDRGLRQADYDVLAGVLAPSVLVEMGFVDHVVEGPQLADPAVQEQLAAALRRGILRYLRPEAAGESEGAAERPARTPPGGAGTKRATVDLASRGSAVR